MIDRSMIEDICIECGNPLDDDNDDICSECQRDQDEMIRHKLMSHSVVSTDDRDGKRLAKQRRPKHKPMPEREKMLPVPKTLPPKTGRPSGQRPEGRPSQQAGGQPRERR